MTDEAVHRQHLVSKVLLKRWAVDGSLISLDLAYPKSPPKPRTTSQVGYGLDFLRFDSKHWEER